MKYVYLENGVPLIADTFPKGKKTIGRASTMDIAQGIADKYVAEHENEFEPQTCSNCEECNYIGEGDSICDNDPTKVVISDWVPTEHFNWCKQSKTAQHS